MARKHWLRGVLVLALLVAGVQLVPVDRANPPVTSDLAAPPEVKAILRRACYDCHSHETRWPWYSRVAPASWFVARHVRKARGELNLSAWPVLDLEEQDEEREEMWHEVEEGDMPLRSYLWLHRDARLSAEDKEVLRRWAMR